MLLTVPNYLTSKGNQRQSTVAVSAKFLKDLSTRCYKCTNPNKKELNAENEYYKQEMNYLYK